LRYFIEIAYNGKKYHGWQRQPNAISVQEKIEEALTIIRRKETSIIGAGRTDAGVHALQLFAHFDCDTQINYEELKHKLNAFLPDDIVVHAIFLVKKDVHARFDALSRSYKYQIYLGRNPFVLETTWQIYSQKITIKEMNKAAAVLLEYTNFKCFSKSKTDVRTYNCKITAAKWQLDGNMLTFSISADRFLRNMVRAIVGTLIDVGLGKTSIADFRKIIESEDRSEAGLSVPAKGLFLTKISYPDIKENIVKKELE